MYFHFRANDSESRHGRRPPRKGLRPTRLCLSGEIAWSEALYATLMMKICVVLDKRSISVNKRFPALLGLCGFRHRARVARSSGLEKRIKNAFNCIVTSIKTDKDMYKDMLKIGG